MANWGNSGNEQQPDPDLPPGRPLTSVSQAVITIVAIVVALGLFAAGLCLAVLVRL